MSGQRKISTIAVQDTDGKVLTPATIPRADTRYWSMRRKAEVVAAVDGGLLTLAEACDRYRMSLEEFESWQHRLERAGKRGLRITKGAQYRKDEARDENG